MIVNMCTNGDLVDRVSHLIADRFFHVESLERISPSLKAAVTTASSERMDRIWPDALRRFRASPVVGCGFNQNFADPGTPAVTIHNGYLDVLVGVGVFGTFPVVLACLGWLSTVWKAVRLPENTPILVPCVGYAITLFAINSGDLVRYFQMPMMLLGLVLGIAMRIALLPPEHGGSRRSRQGGDVPPEHRRTDL